MSVFITPQFEQSGSPTIYPSRLDRSPPGNPSPVCETESDQELIQRVADGDAKAFTSLYLRYAAPVYWAIFRILRNGDIAEEVRQEVFLRIWTQANTYQAGKGTLTAWLHRIARNLALDEFRHQRCRPRLATGDQSEFMNAISDARQDVEQHAIARVMGEAALAALDHLPPTQRQAVELAYLQELTHREVATVLNEPLGTIKSRISMGARKIRTELGAIGTAHYLPDPGNSRPV